MDNRIRSISIASAKHESPRPSQEDSDTNKESPSWLLSELLQNFTVRDKDKVNEDLNVLIIDNGNKLIDLLIQYPTIKRDLLFQTVINKIGFMLYSTVPQIRALCYRIIKYCINNEDSLYILIQNKILIFIIMTLSTDKSSDLEKLYAIKLIQKFLVVDNGSKYLSVGIIKALMHLIDDELFIISNDLKHLTLEIILELSILNPQLIHHSNGFHLLIKTLTNNSNIMILLNCLLIVIKLLENDDLKQIFRNGYNLTSLVSIFDEEVNGSDVNSKIRIQKLQKTSFLLTVFIKNWNGLICFSLNNFQVFGDLINNLRNNDVVLKEFILDILLDTLGIQSLPWLQNSPIGEFLLKVNPNARFEFREDYRDPDDSSRIVMHYMNHYRGLVTFVLMKLDIIDLLLKNLNTSLNEKVILLLSNLYKFSKFYLPQEFDLDMSSNINLNSLIKISNYNLRSTSRISKVREDLSGDQNPVPKLDDTQFKSLINATKVLTIKEFDDWDWKLLLLVFQGPCMHDERKFLEILEKQPKFFKRLLSFYRPFKFRFCNLLVKSKNVKKIIQVGLLIFKVFTKYSAGLKYFYRNKLIIQMSEILAQIDPLSGINARNPILSDKNLKTTVNYGYIKFIGELTSTDAGIGLLSQWQFFQLLDNIIEASESDTKNNNFIHLLFKNIKFKYTYTINLLKKCLSISNPQLKLQVAKLLPGLGLEQPQFVKIIMDNMYQKSLCESLITILYDDYVENQDLGYLKLILEFNPSISILSRYHKGEFLLSQFLLIPEGYNYLSKFNYIETNFNTWINAKKSLQILKFYETKIESVAFPYFSFNEVPPYKLFFKNLLDTRDGLSYFQLYNLEYNFISDLLTGIDTGLQKVLDNEELTDTEMKNLRQNLWILGEINSSNYGIQLISLEFIEKLIDRFYSISHWTIKGLLYFQIGKLALNNEGIEVLDEMNWVSNYNKMDKFTNFTYPKDLGLNFFANDITTIKFDHFDKIQFHNYDELTDEEAAIVELIYKFPSNLTKLDREPTRELLYLKKTYPELFNVEFLLKLIKFIDNSNFNFKKRNFVFNLFITDSNLLEALVKRKK